MTISSHNLVMIKKVKIADFKSRLSEHLRFVRGGDEIVILDRQTPIAKVSSYSEIGGKADFQVRPAKVKGSWKKIKWPSVTVEVDVVHLLRDDRDKR